ncbi:MAG: hypothetical protein GY934_13505 [Gammaproteobacteria bacterium]|nr:hypothetical protein [Gammaproteobacteria bacterium]
MAKKKTEAALATTSKDTAIATFDYGQYGNEGFENTGKEDFAIPFINVLQQLSPQLDDTDGQYIEGAKQGMIVNSVTGDLYKDGLVFQPVITQHTYVEWVPRNAGGGFVAIHDLDSKEVADAKEASTSYGKYKIGENDLIETFYMYGNILDADDTVVSQAMITFTSTKIKVYKGVMTKLRAFQVPAGDRKICPPLFAHRLKVTSVKQQKNQDKFWNFQLAPANGNIKESLIAPDSELMELGQAFYKLVKSGEAKVDHGQQGDADTKKGAVAEDAPF